jgi:hypothetical protein
VPADGVKKSQLQIGFTYYRYKAMNNSTLYCTVPPCNFTTNEGPQLLKHLNSVHPVPNIYTRYCHYPQCNFSYNWNAAFENHLKTVHHYIKQRFGCNLCHTNTSNKSNLTKHKKKYHVASFNSEKILKLLPIHEDCVSCQSFIEHIK